MILLGKIALGMATTVVLATAYTFHEGVIRVDVDEVRDNGSHVHLWVPATVVPAAMRFVPRHELEKAMKNDAAEWMPLVRTITKELENYPDTEFVEVIDGDQHVQVHTVKGKLQVDVDSPDEHVHVACPLETLRDVADQLEASIPRA